MDKPRNDFPEKTNPELMAIADLARRTGLSESFWYQAIAEGRIRHLRFGKGQGGIRISEEMYQEFLKAIEKGGQSVPAPKTVRVKLTHLDL